MADSAGSPMQLRAFRRSEDAPRPHLAWGGSPPDLGGRDRAGVLPDGPSHAGSAGGSGDPLDVPGHQRPRSEREARLGLCWAIAQANRSRQPRLVEITSAVQGGSNPGTIQLRAGEGASARA